MKTHEDEDWKREVWEKEENKGKSKKGEKIQVSQKKMFPFGKVCISFCSHPAYVNPKHLQITRHKHYVPVNVAAGGT